MPPAPRIRRMRYRVPNSTPCLNALALRDVGGLPAGGAPAAIVSADESAITSLGLSCGDGCAPTTVSEADSKEWSKANVSVGDGVIASAAGVSQGSGPGGGGVIVAAATGLAERRPTTPLQAVQRLACAGVSAPQCGQSIGEESPWETSSRRHYGSTRRRMPSRVQSMAATVLGRIMRCRVAKAKTNAPPACLAGACQYFYVRGSRLRSSGAHARVSIGPARWSV